MIGVYIWQKVKNYPWQYHNAGIWPYIGGFLLYKSKQNNSSLNCGSNAINNWSLMIFTWTAWYAIELQGNHGIWPCIFMHIKFIA
jgi:hypothetical protein